MGPVEHREVNPDLAHCWLTHPGRERSACRHTAWWELTRSRARSRGDAEERTNGHSSDAYLSGGTGRLTVAAVAILATGQLRKPVCPGQLPDGVGESSSARATATYR